MLQSSFEDRTISLPMDSAAYEALLREKVSASTFVKAVPTGPVVVDDFATSFAR